MPADAPIVDPELPSVVVLCVDQQDVSHFLRDNIAGHDPWKVQIQTLTPSSNPAKLGNVVAVIESPRHYEKRMSTDDFQISDLAKSKFAALARIKTSP